jgi:iron complex transport system ATP-binding protein
MSFCNLPVIQIQIDQPVISLKKLHIGYASKQGVNKVFSDLNAELQSGQLIGLVGNNGVGKSTLIKTIFGALKPLQGEINLDGKTITNFSLHELSKLISIVLTDKVGGFNLSVFDVVGSGRIPYLNSFSQLKQEDVKIIERSLSQIGISHLKDKLIDELSDGQRQKVMIAKSLAQQTPVILLDEPTAFLDYASKQQLFVILKQLCKEQGKTIIVSSHDLEILFRNADSILYLNENGSFELNKPEAIKKYFTIF